MSSGAKVALVTGQCTYGMQSTNNRMHQQHKGVDVHISFTGPVHFDVHFGICVGANKGY
jgi:hypothetical protein